MAIFITGSIAFDYLMTFPGRFLDNFIPDKLDKISLSFLVDSMTRQRGGIAPNIAYTLSLLGDKPVRFCHRWRRFFGLSYVDGFALIKHQIHQNHQWKIHCFFLCQY